MSGAALPPPSAGPRIAILMATFQGEKYLAQQLASITRQTHTHWSLWISDDGSSDETLSIIRDYAQRVGEHRVHLRKGPQRGATANFFSLLLDSAIDADYFALADQDDLWYEDKLERAIRVLATSDMGATPALYAGRVLWVNAHDEPIGTSRPLRRPLGLAHALTQNIAGGNTMVFNRAARTLIQKAGEPSVPVHDWWIYLLLSASNASLHFDQQPTLRYRQHADNQIGAALSWRQKYRRYHAIAQGQWRAWQNQHLAALQSIQPLLPEQQRQLIDNFSAWRHRPFWQRCLLAPQLGLYRQYRLETLAFYMVGLLGLL